MTGSDAANRLAEHSHAIGFGDLPRSTVTRTKPLIDTVLALEEQPDLSVLTEALMVTADRSGLVEHDSR